MRRREEGGREGECVFKIAMGRASGQASQSAKTTRRMLPHHLQHSFPIINFTLRRLEMGSRPDDGGPQQSCPSHNTPSLNNRQSALQPRSQQVPSRDSGSGRSLARRADFPFKMRQTVHRTRTRFACWLECPTRRCSDRPPGPDGTGQPFAF